MCWPISSLLETAARIVALARVRIVETFFYFEFSVGSMYFFNVVRMKTMLSRKLKHWVGCSIALQWQHSNNGIYSCFFQDYHVHLHSVQRKASNFSCSLLFWKKAWKDGKRMQCSCTLLKARIDLTFVIHFRSPLAAFFPGKRNI